MKRPFGEALDRWYGVFHEDHSRLRRDLLASLPARDAIEQQTSRAPSSPAPGGRIMLNRIVKIAAAVILATAAIGVIRHFAGSGPNVGIGVGRGTSGISTIRHTRSMSP